MSRSIAGFEVVERLGGGAMGEVFRARQPGLDRTVALKLLNPGTSLEGDLARRFSREARIQGALNHAQLVRVIDAGTEDGQQWIAMELIEGPTLAHVIDRGSRLDAALVVAILTQLASGLEHLHAHGVVHRDLKPGNVLMTIDGTCKIADFGLARADGLTVLTRTGQVLGTLAYLAPEAIAVEDVGAPSDIYALGVIGYELATGNLPYRGRGFAAWSRAILAGDATPPIQRRPDLPPVLNDLIVRMLAKDQKKRPTAAAVRRDLEAMAADGLPVAPPERVRVPARREVAPASWRSQVVEPMMAASRGRLLAGAAVVVALALGAGFALRARAKAQASASVPPLPTATPSAVASTPVVTGPVEISTRVTPAGDRARVLLRGPLTASVAGELELVELTPAGARAGAPRVSACELAARTVRDLRGLKPGTVYRLQARAPGDAIRARAVYFRTSKNVQQVSHAELLELILRKGTLTSSAYFIVNQILDEAPDERLAPLVAQLVPLAERTGFSDIGTRSRAWLAKTYDEAYFDLLVKHLSATTSDHTRSGYIALANLHTPRAFEQLLRWVPETERSTQDETLMTRGDRWTWALQASDPVRARAEFLRISPAPATPPWKRMALATVPRYLMFPELVALLATLARDPERAIAVEAARGLGRLGAPAASAIRGALADPAVRALPARTAALVYALARAGTADDARVLSPMLYEAPKNVRAALVYALATLTGARARSLMQNALADDSGSVRAAAAWGLGEYGNAEDVEALDQVLERDSTGRTAVALARLGATATAPHMLDYAKNAWTPNRPEPWASIFWALGQLRHAPARDLLRTAADCSEPLIRFRSQEALAALDAPLPRSRAFLVDAAFPVRTGLKLPPGQGIALHAVGRWVSGSGPPEGRGPGSASTTISSNSLAVEWSGLAQEPWQDKHPFFSCPNGAELLLSRYVESEDPDAVGFCTVRVEVLGDH